MKENQVDCIGSSSLFKNDTSIYKSTNKLSHLFHRF